MDNKDIIRKRGRLDLKDLKTSKLSRNEKIV